MDNCCSFTLNIWPLLWNVCHLVSVVTKKVTRVATGITHHYKSMVWMLKTLHDFQTQTLKVEQDLCPTNQSFLFLCPICLKPSSPLLHGREHVNDNRDWWSLLARMGITQPLILGAIGGCYQSQLRGVKICIKHGHYPLTVETAIRKPVWAKTKRLALILKSETNVAQKTRTLMRMLSKTNNTVQDKKKKTLCTAFCHSVLLHLIICNTYDCVM